MKILVTGTDGFIGNAVASHLVNAGHQVEGWTYIPNKYPDPSQCDRVIHCGAISSTTETDVEKIMTQNTDFTMKLIELCDMMGTSMQYSSTANLYGNTKISALLMRVSLNGQHSYINKISSRYLKLVFPIELLR